MLLRIFGGDLAQQLGLEQPVEVGSSDLQKAARLGHAHRGVARLALEQGLLSEAGAWTQRCNTYRLAAGVAAQHFRSAGFDDVEEVTLVALDDDILPGFHVLGLHRLGTAAQLLERKLLERLGLDQACDALAHAVVERCQAPGLVAAREHIVEPLTIDHQINGWAAQLHAGCRGDGVEDGRVGSVIIDAEGSDVLAAVIASHGQPAFEKHHQSPRRALTISPAAPVATPGRSIRRAMASSGRCANRRVRLSLDVTGSMACIG